MTLILRGSVGRHPVEVSIPTGWSGRVTLSIDCHKGRPSRKIKVSHEEAQHLGERDDSQES